ncbi:BON domain-containing protein [Paractinoplanes abujensis]|uniref:Osmotically-inducible protein OsmY n=1 Tax=Paractinoplanes abujensis TaxID=882441 RepID=A0A7W7G213_9ACTN|nr:BON domain-containing protein [Actinoplanes abujensis]MBB4693234.1 osmotically-inducible protein OsmY [Actinoplanes abujensis]
MDDALARRVAMALLRAPLVASGHLVVDVQNGVAVLAGSLETQEACDAAAEQAMATPGVRDVLNQLTVSPSPARKRR